MKTFKKLFPLLLSLVFVISSVMTITAFAATKEQDGLAASLTFDKKEYDANEEIKATLTVKNNLLATVKDIETEITLPDGITLKSGSLTQDAFDLPAGDDSKQEVTFVKIVKEPDTSKGGDDDSQTDTSSGTPDSPKTGDQSHIGLFVALMILSGGALLVLGIRRKNLYVRGILSLILCFTLAGTMLPVTTLVASEKKNFTLEETVIIDGTETTFRAAVSYVLADDEEDVYTITATSTGNGEISPAGDVTINRGESQTFTFTPYDGYRIADIKIDGVSEGETDYTYTFEDVKANHTIEVIFVRIIMDSDGTDI